MVQIAKIFQLSRQVICFQRMQEHLLQVLAANTVTDGPDLRGAPRKMPIHCACQYVYACQYVLSHFVNYHRKISQISSPLLFSIFAASLLFLMGFLFSISTKFFLVRRRASEFCSQDCRILLRRIEGMFVSPAIPSRVLQLMPSSSPSEYHREATSSSSLASSLNCTVVWPACRVCVCVWV